MERWELTPGHDHCDGCKFLDGKLFPAGVMARPPLHYGCQCRLVRVDPAEFGPAAQIRMALEAEWNGRHWDQLARRAWRLYEGARAVGKRPRG